MAGRIAQSPRDDLFPFKPPPYAREACSQTCGLGLLLDDHRRRLIDASYQSFVRRLDRLIRRVGGNALLWRKHSVHCIAIQQLIEGGEVRRQLL